MSLTMDRAQKLEYYLSALLENRKVLSEWERGFLDDTVNRYSEYGADIRLSHKQWAVLDRMYEKATDDAPWPNDAPWSD